MANGSFNLSRSASTSSYITFKCIWSSVANAANNTSRVTVKISATKSGSSTADTYGNYTASVKVGTETQSVGSTSFRLSPNETMELLSKTFTVAHNANGTKSVQITANVGGNVMAASGSATVTLDKIDLTPSSITSFTITAGYGNYVGIGDVIRMSWTKPSGNVTGYEIQYSRGEAPWASHPNLENIKTNSWTDSFTASNRYNLAGSAVKYRVRALNGVTASAWKESNTLYMLGGMNLKVSNAWKLGTTWINVNGVWKRAKRVWIKINGTWKYSI